MRFIQAKGLASVSRDLGYSGPPLSNWTLYGDVDYEGNYPNVGRITTDNISGGSFLDLLDNKGKIILRLYMIFVHNPTDAQFYVNDTLLFQGKINDFKKIAWKPQLLKLSCRNGNLLFQYGNLRPIAVRSLDPSANQQSPSGIRILFWGNGNNYERDLDLKNFHFIKD